MFNFLVYFTSIDKKVTKNIMAKVINKKYTNEMENRLRDEYLAANSDEERSEVVANLAEEFAKSPRSIVGKLASMEIYVKADEKRAARKPVETKEQIAAICAGYLGFENGETFGAENANKVFLERLRSHFQSLENDAESA